MSHATTVDARLPALVAGLEAAVPLWMAELRSLTPDQRAARVQVWARDSADVVAHRGDILMYRGKRSGGTAAVFNALARGLAAAAHAPGGVAFAGRHWCVEHPWGIAVGSAELTCTADGLADQPDVPAIVTVELVAGVL